MIIKYSTNKTVRRLLEKKNVAFLVFPSFKQNQITWLICREFSSLLSLSPNGNKQSLLILLLSLRLLFNCFLEHVQLTGLVLNPHFPSNLPLFSQVVICFSKI